MTFECQNENCSKESTLHCPKCVALKIDEAESAFCSQECFKSCWPTHKQLHKIAMDNERMKAAQKRAFDSYPFTGELRPGFVSPMQDVPNHIQKPDYAADGTPYSERAVRGSNKVTPITGKNLEKLKVVCRLAAEILQLCGSMCQPGVTPDQINQAVHAATVEADAYPSPLNYRGFPKSVCISVNEVICHGIPDNRPLVEGDIVNCDVTAFKDGYHGDCNATFYVGKCDAASKKLVECTRACLAAAIAMVKPGVMYRDIGKPISRIAKKNKFSVVKSYCGHGIGTLFHCAPNIPHYANNKGVGIMREGHVFTIEPMINAGTWKDRLWPDDWTAVTEDGRRSAQFEHTMIVTKKGVEVLTMTPTFDVVRNPPPEALDHTGATTVKAPAHLAKHAQAVGVTVAIESTVAEPTTAVEQTADDNATN